MRDVRSNRSLRDRWLVSYADLVTILLACFATTYAASARTPESGAGGTSGPPHVVSRTVAAIAAAAFRAP